MVFFRPSSMLLASALSCILTSFGVAAFEPPAVFENLRISKAIDLTSSYIRESIALSIKNIGDEPQSVYYYALDPNSFSKIAIFEGREKRNDGNVRIINVSSSQKFNKEKNVNYYEIELAKPLQPGQETVLQLGAAIINNVQPSPEYAEQSASQLMTLEDSRVVLSAYKTHTQRVIVKTLGLQNEDISLDDDEDDEEETEEETEDEEVEGDDEKKDEKKEEKSKAKKAEKPVNKLAPAVDRGTMTYGPFNDTEPYTTSPFVIRYEYPAPIVKTIKLERDIWISHWGASASFEESYQLHHIGTKLKDNKFSRLEYMKRPTGKYNLNIATFKGVEISLPPNARDLYYTDLVGNVSTSHFRVDDYDSSDEDEAASAKSSLILKPRYPLFGGWNYNFTIGWSTDLSNYLRSLGNEKYLLKVPLIQGPEDMAYDDVIVNIILPEGATNIDLATLHPSQPELLYVTKSYLDFQGRPSLQLVYKNFVDGYKRTNLYVTYTYSSTAFLKKPFTVSVVFFAIFCAIVFLSKIDLSISSHTLEKKKNK